jgi:tetratricopeptide (TPR) repeat protein
MQAALSAAALAPTAANLQTFRSVLVADPAYDPYSDDLNQLGKLVRKGQHREAAAFFNKSLPNLLLSPRAHDLASKAALGLGDKATAQAESMRQAAYLDAIAATGDGSQARPFRIARLSDEEDFLTARYNARINSQGLVFQDDRKFDRVFASDGATYWFDVGMFFERKPATPPSAAVAAAANTPVNIPPVDALANGAAPTTTSDPKPALTAEAPDDTAKPVKQNTPSVETSPGKAAAQRGREAYRARKYDAAIAALDEAIQLEAKNASFHVDRGNASYARRDYPKAVADFSEAIHLDPQYATAYSNRAFALSTMGDQDRAIADFNSAIRLQANFGRAYNGRGYAFQVKGMVDTAIADFDVAINLDPNYAAAYENRSAAYALKGDKQHAEADATKASELRKPKSSPAVSATASATHGD